jgi:hypothetical protein
MSDHRNSKSLPIAHCSIFTSDDLEIMSSLVFLYENEELEGEVLIKRTRELKPRFPEEKIRDSAKIFKILGNFAERYKQHIPVPA